MTAISDRPGRSKRTAASSRTSLWFPNAGKRFDATGSSCLDPCRATLAKPHRRSDARLSPAWSRHHEAESVSELRRQLPRGVRVLPASLERQDHLHTDL